MPSRIKAISTYLPQRIETVDDLEEMFPEWSSKRISEKTGIFSRHISADDEFSSHMAVAASRKLFVSTGIQPEDVDCLILVTQTPDFILPTTACLVHEGLGLRADAGALDVNLGCSGYVYALGLAKGLIDSKQVRNVLVVTSDTYTKLLNPLDKSVRSIFGDGATATLLDGDGDSESITGLVQGTDGSGAGLLIVPHGGLRDGAQVNPAASAKERKLEKSQHDLYMDGPGIFNFTLRVVGPLVHDSLEKSNLSFESVDYIVFHQANAFMLKHIVEKLDIPLVKAPILMRDWGNTVSSTIPMALHSLLADAAARDYRLLLAGFGVGLSWAGIAVKINPSSVVFG
jgi:3-oxoacyl-[acyl-carrier-protein] synthase-3